MLPEYDSYLPAQVVTHKGMTVVSIPCLSHRSLTQEQSTDIKVIGLRIRMVPASKDVVPKPSINLV